MSTVSSRILPWLADLARLVGRADPPGDVEASPRGDTDRTRHPSRTEEALRLSEERYRIVSELTSDYAFSVRIDPDQTIHREWITEAFARITGYDPNELTEEMWQKLVHPDDHALRREQFQRALLTGQLHHQYRILRKNGETRWIQEHARVLRNEDGSLHWYGACQDITEQKLAQNELALTQERFDAITQSSRDVITVLDQNGQIVYASPNLAELAGYEPDELPQQTRDQLIHPDDRQRVDERLAKLMISGESDSLLCRMRHGQGNWRWIDSTATAFHGSSGEIRAVLVSRDVTDRREMEGERRRLVSVVENSSEFIAMTSADGRILFLNDAGRMLLGVDGGSATRTHSIFDCLCADDSRAMRLELMPAVQRNGHWEGDLHFRHCRTGSRIATLAHVFPVSNRERDGEPVLAIVARDISERITAEQRLRESEARYRLLVESAYDLIAEFDAEGRYVYASPNFKTQLGYPPEALLGTLWLDAFHPDDRAGAREALGGLSASETPDWPPLRLRHRHGGWCWIEANFKRYESLDGGELVIAFFRDVTRRKLAEEALRQSQEQLLHSQKMEAIGRLAGGIAHDFNNLLTAIKGYGDLLLQEIGNAGELRHDAEEILRAADRAADLTRQLLAFSRRQALLPKVLDLNTLVANFERLLRRLIGENIDLVTAFEAEQPCVMLDPGQLEQLVLNLCVNARDAMPHGGQLTLTTANVEIPPDGDPAHSGIAAGRYVTLVVRDTGVGMRREIASKIFEPFFTTKEAGKGTGLGLATVYGIVRQSSGEVRVDSVASEGTTISVYLPRVDEVPVAARAPDPAEDLRGSETILLVEDSDTVRRLLRRSLEQHGYTVIDASSGDEALRRASEHDGRLDLLVTDVVLPKLDGHELAQRLARLRPGIAVLYMSGFSEDALTRHGVVASDIALVHKPFAPPALMREMRRLLDGTRDASHAALDRSAEWPGEDGPG